MGEDGGQDRQGEHRHAEQDSCCRLGRHHPESPRFLGERDERGPLAPLVGGGHDAQDRDEDGLGDARGDEQAEDAAARVPADPEGDGHGDPGEGEDGDQHPTPGTGVDELAQLGPQQATKGDASGVVDVGECRLLRGRAGARGPGSVGRGRHQVLLGG
ncbi:hypothetical protein [Ornithinimicrobium kibberense]|uniref:hypothetical protein n=1 Tax=Ornithinimicrobium kibberense TaxID=282060 RepID=UPI003620C765